VKSIETLEELDEARNNRKSVICPEVILWRGIAANRPLPAAWVINLPGAILLTLFRSRLQIYEKETPEK